MTKDKEPAIISAEDIEHFDVWRPPTVSGKTINPAQAVKSNAISSKVTTTVTAQDVEQIRLAAYQEGLDAGKAEGLAKITNEQKHLVDGINEILESCFQQRATFDEQLSKELVSLTISIATQIVRHELKTEPEQVLQVINEALSCLPNSNEQIGLKLNPEDAALVKDVYKFDDNEQNWRIYEEPTMARGGCVITTENSTVNADMEDRIATIVERLLNGNPSNE